MKRENDLEPYFLTLNQGEACLTEKRTYFQLVNSFDSDSFVLYISSPEFIFEMENESVLYNDAIILDENWDELKSNNWNLEFLKNEKCSPESRIKSYMSISKNKSKF